MKAGINQWAFPGDMPTTEAISHAHWLGFEAFEVCVEEEGRVPLDISEAGAVAIRKHADALGVTLCSMGCGLHWRYPLSSPEESTREKGREITRQALRIAHWMEIESLLVVPGTVTENAPYDLVLEHSLASLHALRTEAEKQRVAIALENVWNRFLLSPTEFRDFIDQCDSAYIGAYFDIGNVLAFGYPEQWIRILGRRIKAVHAKDFRTEAGTLAGFVMLLEGDVNWPAVMQALREAGYINPLIAEYFTPAPAYAGDAMLRQILTGLKTITSL